MCYLVVFIIALYYFFAAFDLDSDCCGRRFPFSRRDSLPAAPFQRQCAGAAFHARQGLSPRSDVAPPGRVLDLRVAGAKRGIGGRTREEETRRTAEEGNEDFVRLEWTAPGGDYDQGKGESLQR